MCVSQSNLGHFLIHSVHTMKEDNGQTAADFIGTVVTITDTITKLKSFDAAVTCALELAEVAVP